MPYRKDENGRGVAWANSLFEDNAEFGLGMKIASETLRHKIEDLMLGSLSSVPNALKALYHDWIENRNDTLKSAQIRDRLVPLLEQNLDAPRVREILELKQYLNKKSQWIIGGDGWAYDIGFGGVDHVLASGKDINILVFDTEVYSNTGGQSSKSTKTGAIAQFAAGGKETKKKDLAGIAMTYGYVYVAQISMGADMNQALKALAEAEAYPGPSLIIAYSPCINHGIKKGMNKAMTEEKLAVESGYWNNFRFNPAAEKKFTLDSKAPKEGEYRDFLMGEVRYNSLMLKNPERAEQLFTKNEQDAMARYEYLKKLVALYDDSKTE